MTLTSEREVYEYYQKEGKTKHQFATDFKTSFHKKRYSILKDTIRSISKGITLDIGCAEGWSTAWASEYAELAIGIDISIPKVKRAVIESKTTNTEFIVGSFDYLPFKNDVFDLVIWSEGPEHALDPESVFNQIFNLLKNKGRLFISTMGLEPPSYYCIFRKLIGKWENDLKELHSWGHSTLFTKDSLQKILEKHFTMEKEFFIGPNVIIPVRIFQYLLERFMEITRKDYARSAWPGFGCLFLLIHKRQ